MDLFEKYREVTSNQRKYEIEEALITEHAPLASFWGKKYAYAFGSNDDAQQEAYIALLHAIRHYEPSIAQFSTYAVTIIKRHLQGRAKRWERSTHQSIEGMVEDDDRRNEVEALLRFDDRAFENVVYEDLLLFIKENLSEREYDVLKARLKGESLQTIGDKLHLSRERIRQIEIRAKAKAREALIVSTSSVV